MAQGKFVKGYLLPNWFTYLVSEVLPSTNLRLDVAFFSSLSLAIRLFVSYVGGFPVFKRARVDLPLYYQGMIFFMTHG